MAMLSSLIALSTAQISNAMFNSLNSSSVALQAQQFADNKATIIKATSYDNLDAQHKNLIQNTNFKDEIVLSEETESEDYLSRTATVNIYYKNETSPRVSLAVLRTNATLSAVVPIGTIITWAADTLPSDGIWLHCNGQSTTGYPELASLIGSNVPDYRGIFLRGKGSTTSNHFGSVVHSSADLGVLQGDAIRNIAGNFTATTGMTNTSIIAGGVFSQTWYSNGHQNGTKGRMPVATVTFSTDKIVPTANENRPINKAVHFLIKAA